MIPGSTGSDWGGSHWVHGRIDGSCYRATLRLAPLFWKVIGNVRGKKKYETKTIKARMFYDVFDQPIQKSIHQHAQDLAEET